MAPRPVIAEQVADLLRQQLQLNLGATAFSESLATLRQLEPYVTDLQGEIAWWQWRQATLAGDAQAIRNARQRLATAPDRLLRFENFSVSLNFLRQNIDNSAKPRPAPLANDGLSVNALKRWSVNNITSQRVVRSGNRLIAFQDGWLRGFDLTTGTETWRAQPAMQYQPLVGFQVGQMRGLGTAPTVGKVLPGTTASAIGLRAGDRLIHLNGQALAAKRRSRLEFLSQWRASDGAWTSPQRWRRARSCW